MTIKTNYLNKKLFFSDLTHLFPRRKENLEPFMETIEQLLDASKDAFLFLTGIDCIEDIKIQCACRRVAIAQMYGVKVDYDDNNCSSRNYISYCSNRLAVIEMPPPYSTAVLVSGYGDVVVDDGLVCINGKAHYPAGWVAKQIVDGELTWNQAVYSSEGKVVIPFGIFDDIELHLEINTAKYKGVEFYFRVYGSISDMSTKTLKCFLDDWEETLLYNSPENVVFHLLGPMATRQLDEEEAKVFLELQETLSPFRLTEERIKEELDRRMD